MSTDMTDRARLARIIDYLQVRGEYPPDDASLPVEPEDDETEHWIGLLIRLAEEGMGMAPAPQLPVDAATANLHAMMSDGLDRLTTAQTKGLAPMADHVQSTILSWAQGAQSDIVDMLGAKNRSAVPAAFVVLFRGAMDAMATCARTLGHSEQQVLELVSAAYRKPTMVVVPVDGPVGKVAQA